MVAVVALAAVVVVVVVVADVDFERMAENVAVENFAAVEIIGL